MKEIEITNDEAMAASSIATLQMLRKVTMSRKTDHGSFSKRRFRERLGDTFLGLVGEIAVSKYLNKSWSPGGSKVSTGDVSNSIEVRTTDHPDGHLLVYDRDNDESVFYFVVGDFPKMSIVGKIKAKDAKQPKYMRDSDPPCYWVPQSDLNNI